MSMKSYIIMALCLLVLTTSATAADFPGFDTAIPCTTCGYESSDAPYGAGEPITLDGTVTPPTITYQGAPYDADVSYLWTFWKITFEEDVCSIISGTPYVMYDQTGDPIGSTFASPVGDEAPTGSVGILAPTEEGCYMAVLTVTYTISIPRGGGLPPLELKKACVDWDCEVFCVDYDCVVCNDIFCDVDCAIFPTGDTTGPYYCTDYTGEGLCYPNYLDEEGNDQIGVKWYKLTGSVENPTETDLGSGELLATGFCWLDADQWCTVGEPADKGAPGTYTIVMAVYGTVIDPDSGTITNPLTYICKVGEVVIVVEPIASIGTS